MYRIWVKRVYIKGIASDRNSLVTGADFEHISPILGDNITLGAGHVKV